MRSGRPAPPLIRAQAAGSGRVEIAVLSRNALGIAPMGMFFRAAVSDPVTRQAEARAAYDPSWHDCLYIWEFGDSRAVSDKVVNLAAAQNDLNRAYGKEVGHVFTRAGRYTVTCTVYGPQPDGRIGLIGRDEMPVTVAPADGTFFPREHTILFDPDGRGDPQAFPGAQVARSFDAAMQSFYALRRPGRILCRRGSRGTIAARYGFGAREVNFHLGAYGDGPRPVLTAAPGLDRDAFAVAGGFTGDFVIEGVRLQGLWDSVTETGESVIAVNLLQAANGPDDPPNPRVAVLDDVVIDGFGMAVFLPTHRSAAGGITGSFLNNSVITNWRSIGYYSQNNEAGAVSITGCRVFQPSEANAGGSGDQNTQDSNALGCGRLAHGGRLYMAVSDHFSKCGWSLAGAYPADQACLRWNSNIGLETSGVIERSAFEGGTDVLLLTFYAGGRGGPVRPTSNFLIDKCLIVGSAGTGALVTAEFPGLTLRNSLLVNPNTPAAHGNARWWSAISLRVQDRLRPDDPVSVYSNTYVNLLDDANRGDRPLRFDDGQFEAFARHDNVNNVSFTPNAPAPNALGQPPEDPMLTRTDLVTAGGVWTPLYTGRKWRNGALERRFATPPGSVDEFRPEPGSPLIGTAMGQSAIDDFWGGFRGDTPSRGASEPG